MKYLLMVLISVDCNIQTEICSAKNGAFYSLYNSEHECRQEKDFTIQSLSEIDASDYVIVCLATLDGLTYVNE